MPSWIAVALLSASWLLGLGFYHQPDWTDWQQWLAWGGLALPAIVLMMLSSAGQSLRHAAPRHVESIAALAALLPALWIAPWPYRVCLLLLFLGLLLRIVPLVWPGIGRIASSLMLSGAVLLAQSLAFFCYESLTARSHDLPGPLAHLVAAVAWVLGVRVAVYESTLAAFSMREVQLLRATWELLLDPASLCFLVGGVVLVCWKSWAALPPGRRLWHGLLGAGILLVIVALWLPVRAGVLIALYLHDILRLDYDAPMRSMRLLWDPWVHLVLVLPPAVVAGCLLRWPRRGTSVAAGPAAATAGPPAVQRALSAALVGIAAALLTAAVFWDPVGTRAPGRVVIEEGHVDPSKVAHPRDWPTVWEPSDKPFDTTWYGRDSGYNYYCIVDYSSRFYDVTRLREPITAEALGECDVLVLKVPMRAYSPGEVECVRAFVEQGGGLLLVGEHTDVYKTCGHLNAVAEQFGFRFRYDCLFGIDSVFDEHYEPPLVPHPVIGHMGPLDFAISCSIDPGRSSGRAVIRGTGLKSLLADYHASNFYPQPGNRAEMRYGAFVQLWATRYGRGRVLAFTDSTIFSNFSTFEPGKSELWLGMLEWLNHRSRLPHPRWPLAVCGLLALLAGLIAASVQIGYEPPSGEDRPTKRKRNGARTGGSAAGGWRPPLRIGSWPAAWVLLLAAGVFGWSLSVLLVRAAHGYGMSAPEPIRPLTQVVMDRTVCQSELPKNGFISGKEKGFGIFERWILRLGYFTARREGAAVFSGDMVVFLYPSQPIPPHFRDQLVAYVRGGGKVLLVDSPENADSTANDLLHPFGMAIDASELLQGNLQLEKPWPAVPVQSAAAVTGGEPWARLAGKPVAASAREGSGVVVAIGFGSRFSDANMGYTGDVEPDDALKQLYELEFSLLRAIVNDGL